MGGTRRGRKAAAVGRRGRFLIRYKTRLKEETAFEGSPTESEPKEKVFQMDRGKSKSKGKVLVGMWSQVKQGPSSHSATSEGRVAGLSEYRLPLI